MKPCETCPWRRDAAPGALGGSHPFKYIGQVHGPFWLPCHNSPGYSNDCRNPQHRQCAGAAIFRANIGVSESLPEQLDRLPADREAVLSTPVEFLAHHSGISVDAADALLKVATPKALLLLELADVKARPMFQEGE